MAVLYIDRRGTSLRLDGGALQLRTAQGESRSLPFGLLDRVVIQAETSLTSPVLLTLGERGIPVTLIDSRRPERSVALCGGGHGDARRRIAQYSRSRDEAWRREFAARTVAAKLREQRRLLVEAAAERGELAGDLHAAARAIAELEDKVRRGPPADRASLLGWEGAASASYFRAFSRLFAPALEFHGRNRRPPRDPVNVCLSLAYTLLHGQAVSAIAGAGLDPFIGFYHEIDYGRASLASDLVEVFRPQADRWVWRTFRARLLRREHFRFGQDRETLVLGAGPSVFPPPRHRWPAGGLGRVQSIP